MESARVADAESLSEEDTPVRPAFQWEARAKIASNVSLVVNLFLLISNFTAYWLTGSLSLLSTAADSFLDLLSQIIIAIAIRGNKRVDKDIWPLGRSRLEPVGLIIVSSLMGIAAFQILGESIMRLTAGLSSDTVPQTPKFETPSIVMVSTAIAVKSVLFLVCWSVAKYSSSMAVLAEDHRNDVLSNIVALIAGLVSNAVPSAWFADPVGAILISIYICIRWVLVGKDQAVMLIGKVASPEFLEQVKLIATTHDEKMDVDVIRAYHFGHRFLVEVEVVVSRNTGIVDAHDSALALQKKIENLEEVERAHVHVDYEHRDEDEHKQTFDPLEVKKTRTSDSVGLHRRHQRYVAVDDKSITSETTTAAGI